MAVQKLRRGEYDLKDAVEQRRYGFFWYDWIWSALRPALVVLVSLMIVLGLVSTGWNYVNNKYLLPVDESDSEPVLFEVESGSSLTAIARRLEEAGLVRSATVFRYYVDFQGMSGRIRAGAYNLRRDMTMSELLAQLTSTASPSERTVRLIEGWTCEEIAAYLVSCGALNDTAEFLRLCGDTAEFADCYVIDKLIESTDASRVKGRRYALEGYLAPDTYELYLTEAPASIIRRLLAQSEKLIWEVYDQREERKSALLDPNDQNASTDDVDLPGVELSQDELYILASMIEKEAKPQDFARVSAVFHNRLAKRMALESCATVQYALGIKRLALTKDDLAVSSPYNTYLYTGLPVGPICNPSRAALLAAAFPDQEYLNEGYLYFCCREPKSGELEFSRTYEEHLAAVERYRPLWIQYDNAAAQG